MDSTKLRSVLKKVSENIDTSMSPYFCNTDDGIYVVKFKENTEGSRGLVNEYICYELANLIGVPIPKAKLIEIPKESVFYIDNRSSNRVRVKFGFAFGSEFIDAMAVISEKMIFDCINKHDFLKIILFDHIIENMDRDTNYGNLLLDRNNNIVLVIDNERVFGAGNIWNEISCRQRMKDPNKLLNFKKNSIYFWMKNSTPLQNYRTEVESSFSKVSESDIHRIVNEIPSDWDCSPTDRRALIDYLLNRFTRVKSLLDLILI